MESVSEDDYSVVKDVERNLIIAAGPHSEMCAEVERLNEVYQSNAYRVVKWTDYRIY